MTSDPKAPGAAAVYLYNEEVDNNQLHYMAFYARIKVLSEKGKEAATVEVPYLHQYMKVTDIKARTIHADGTIVPLEGKLDDLLVVKTGDQTLSRKVFNLPAVEVGSILEYRYQIRYDDGIYFAPRWQVQQSFFVHKAHYVFTPVEAFRPGNHLSSGTYMNDENGHEVRTLLWWANLPKEFNIKLEVGGNYLLDVAEIPAIPDEDYMPPINSFLNRVNFYYKHELNSTDYWVESAKLWSKDADRFADSSKLLKEAVAKLVDPADASLEKARKIYMAVQALDNTDYTRRKSQTEKHDLKIKDIKRAEDVWKQKSGDSEDIALLYLSMLRVAGLKAYAVKVVARNRGVFDPSYMFISQLDDTLVELDADGKATLLDPGEKFCPFGKLGWKHSGVRGLGQGEKEPGLAETHHQTYLDNVTTRTGNVTLDAHGSISNGSLQFIYRGQGALYWRQQALQNDVDELKKQFDNNLQSDLPEGVEAHLDHFIGMESADSNLIAIVRVSGRMGATTGKRLMLPEQFFVARGHRPFVDQEKRLEPVDLHYAGQTVDQMTYTLPDGYKVEGAPADSNLSWVKHAVYLSKSTQTPGTFVVGRRMITAFDLSPAEEYKDLRDFYLKVATADQQQVVLVRAPATSIAPSTTAAPPAAPAGGKGN